MILRNYQPRVAFDQAKFKAVPLEENERAKVMLVCFRPGQFIPVHTPRVDLTFAVLEGEGLVIAGEREEKIGRGAIVFVPAGERRGIKAETELVIVSVVTPPPTDEDHTEVKAKLETSSLR